jgi:uncharacterized protein (UPF0248 family)
LIICICCPVLIVWGCWLYVTYSSQDRVQSIKPTPNLPGEELRSLPYASWKPIDKEEIKKVGVTQYFPQLACNGVNLFFTDKVAGGYLFDMNGKILHYFRDKREEKSQWKLMEPCLNDDFLVLIENHAMFRIDWDSNVKWVQVVPFHHDIAVGDNGDIYSVANFKVLLPAYCPNEPIYDNVLMILTGQGELKKGISFANMVARNKELFYAATHPLKREHCYDKDAWDIFHMNTIEIIDRDVYDGDRKLFGKGDVLFCIRHLNIIGAANMGKKEIVWYWGLDELEYPHHPSLLDNGNILLFDNGSRRKYSRVIELDPRSGEIVWEYKGVPPESFFSADRGSAQRLPNGNTLITDSAEGRVIEVTKDGEVVWEFYNPVINKKEKKRAMVYRMVRFTDPKRFPRLKIR